ncbi:MAG: response regulator [Pseudomonadota bacterium]
MSARILVIDDDPILAGLLQLTLELEGYEVSVASDGDAGMKMVTTERFDLILLDLVMPKIDGIKFLRLLAESGAHRPPVMIVSSAIEENLTDQYRALGVVDIARKPVEPAELVKRARRALANGAPASNTAGQG